MGLVCVCLCMMEVGCSWGGTGYKERSHPNYHVHFKRGEAKKLMK